jgi:hypothetical protein
VPEMELVSLWSGLPPGYAADTYGMVPTYGLETVTKLAGAEATRDQARQANISSSVCNRTGKALVRY